MLVNLKQKDIDNVIVIGDRILLKPTKPIERTESGILLPQGIHKKEEVFTAYVIKVGPGYPIPASNDYNESWKGEEEVKYVPLQPKPGDMAVYLQKSVFPITIHGEEYIIAPQNAILLLVRDEEFD